MAEIGTFVNTASTPGGDGTTNNTTGSTRAYAGKAEWEAAEQTDLVSDGDTHVVDLDGAGGADSESAGVSIVGWTAGVSNDITCRQNSSGSPYTLDNSGGTTSVLRPAEDYITLDGFTLESKYANSGAVTLDIAQGTFTSADNNIVVKNMTIFGTSTSGTSYMVFASKANLILDFYNNVVYGGRRAMDARLAATVAISFCTVYMLADNLGLVLDNSSTVKNTYCGRSSGSQQDFWTGGTAPAGSNNVSSDTTATTDYTASHNSKAPGDQFVSLTGGSEDFHLKSGSFLEGEGTTVSGITTDFEGDTRDVSTPDVGYDELASAGNIITADQDEEGDTQSASLQALAQITANQTEDGDTQSASLQAVAQLSANQIEEGDVQSASFQVIGQITVNQAEDGDTQVAALTGTITSSITANQIEEGDIQSAAFQALAQILANQTEEDDNQVASLQLLAQINANQLEAGDTQIAFILSGSVIAPTGPGLEWTLDDNKLHYSLDGKMEYTLPLNKIHYTLTD